MKTTKLRLEIPDEAQYVRLLSGLVPKGLTKAEMKIVIMLLQLQIMEGSTAITQEMKEKARLILNINSQTMHNYWNGLKKKGVVTGRYKNYAFNKLFQNNVELTITFNAESKVKP